MKLILVMVFALLVFERHVNAVGNGLDDSYCLPYISHYTDCTDANICSGCTRCQCNESGKWECKKVHECIHKDIPDLVDEEILDNAIDVLFSKFEKNKNKESGSLVPPPPKPEEDELLVPDAGAEIDEQLRILMGRQKRSVENDTNNASVKFYETVDEINEDTLKGMNSTGTIKAQKVNAREMGKMSRKKDILNHSNVSDISALHIEYNKPHDLEHHIAENKIDSKHPTEDKINGINHDEIHKILGNYSQIFKDKDLSKLVVNELTHGSERIGDKNVVPVSNITFTAENDTLTAMTFIAGNLLNKLWDMEKDVNEGSIETEAMKHEKINDLLDLFKEPLSLRQEGFLKNALAKLSQVIDSNKDVKNMSVCATIEDTDISAADIKNCTAKSKMVENQNSSETDTNVNSAKFKTKSGVTANAINKINDVLILMKKYEQLQKKMSEIKNYPELNIQRSQFTLDDKVSLNLFGHLLEKITKLLSPSQNKRSIIKRIQMHNMLRKDDIAKKNVEKILNVNLANKTMSTKDKVIIDYLTHMENHPNCFFTPLQKPVNTQLSNVEGSILYNLSEFFKIKSFADLLNMVNNKENNFKYIATTTTTSYPSTTKTSTTTVRTLKMNSTVKSKNMASLKEKLINDIKNIVQDLFDLQKEHGMRTNSNIKVEHVLPCIYNILKSDGETPTDNWKDKERSTTTSKISSLIDALKLDMKFMLPNRRSNINNIPRPKSAVVWERVIKNLHKNYSKGTRRYMSKENPKTFKELRDMMDKVELSANSYKNVAIQSGVAPSERLILLKTLEADIKQYIKVLETIEKTLKITNLSLDKQNELIEFVDNAAMNINLNKKLIDFISKLKERVSTIRDTRQKSKMAVDFNQQLNLPKWRGASDNISFKLKRDQIMNQLMINRLRFYIKSKERTAFDLNANANYNIAKRVLFHLENGNIALAKELYKVFLANKQQETFDELDHLAGYHEKDRLVSDGKVESRGPRIIAFKEPLVRVDDPKKIKMLNQEYLLKQLWNLKELKE